jgi:hypothetical protein
MVLRVSPDLIVYLVAPGAEVGLAAIVGVVTAEGGLIEGVVAGTGAVGIPVAVRSGGRIRGDPAVAGAVPGAGGAITGASELGTLPVVPSAVAVDAVPVAAAPTADGVPATAAGVLGPPTGLANAASGGVAAAPEGAGVIDGPIVSVWGTEAPGAIGSLMRPAAGSVPPASASRDAVARDLGELKA